MDQGKGQAPANAEAVPPNGANEETAALTQEQSEEAVRKETHLRVLTESKKYKQRAAEAEARLKAIEESQMSEKQQYKELYERTKAELETERKTKTELQLKTQLMPKLTAAGCRDVVDAMKLGNTSLLLQDADSDSLVGIDEYVSDLQQRKPWLFDNGRPSSVNPSLPSAGKVPLGQKQDYSRLTKEQIMDQLRSLSKN